MRPSRSHYPTYVSNALSPPHKLRRPVTTLDALLNGSMQPRHYGGSPHPQQFGISCATSQRASGDRLTDTGLTRESETMDFVNEATIISLAPAAAKKTVLLGAFRDASEIPSLEIRDPYAGEIADVRRCYAELDRCVARLARELLAHSVRHEGTLARHRLNAGTTVGGVTTGGDNTPGSLT